MIVILNGFPGVGKLTIGKELAALLKARLVDIHTLYNLAFALTEFRTPAFHETVRRVESIADDLIAGLPDDVPVVFTTVLSGKSDWVIEEWQRFCRRGDLRPPLIVVHILCDLDENIRRIQSPTRQGKLRDEEVARRNHASEDLLIGGDLTHTLRLDVTRLTPEDAALKIAEHCTKVRSEIAGQDKA